MKKILSLFLLIYFFILLAPVSAGIFQGNLTSAQTCGMGHFELGAFGTLFPDRLFGKGGAFVGGKVTFGLLDSLDLGVRYGLVPVKIAGIQPTIVGGEARFRLINENFIWPTLSIFGDYYRVGSGLETINTNLDVAINDFGGGVTLSKALGPLTPFGSVSYSFGSVTYAGQTSDIINLQDLLGSLLFSAGIEFNLGLLQLVGEVNFIRDLMLYSAGVNLKI